MGDQIFQGILYFNWPNYKKTVNTNVIVKIGHISAEPGAWVYNEQNGLTFEEGNFTNDNKYSQFNYLDFPNVSSEEFQTYENVFKENICSNCRNKGNNIFCDIDNENCLSRLHILQSIKPEQISQCSIISHPGPFTQQYLSSCSFFPGFENNPQIRKLMLTYHQGWKEIFKQTRQSGVLGKHVRSHVC